MTLVNSDSHYANNMVTSGSFFFSSRRRHTRYWRGLEFRRVLFRSSVRAAGGNGVLLQLREEQRDLAGGGLVGVRAVDDVVLHLEAEVAADRAGGGLHRVGGAGQRAERLDRARALDDEREQRAAGDELHQRAEERLLAVLAVVLLGDVAVPGAQLGGDEAQALGLQARDRLADQATGDAVGLDEDEGAGGGGFRHERGAYAAGSPSPRGAGSRKGWPSSSLRTCSRYSQISTKMPPTNHMAALDRKSTRLNSSHANISYAV